MNRWLLIPAILILAVSTAFSGYSYFQQNSKLDDALNELSALHDSISSFERDLIPLKADIFALEVQLNGAEGIMGQIQEDIVILETHDRIVPQLVEMLEPSVVRIEYWSRAWSELMSAAPASRRPAPGC